VATQRRRASEECVRTTADLEDDRPRNLKRCHSFRCANQTMGGVVTDGIAITYGASMTYKLAIPLDEFMVGGCRANSISCWH
jgi:hypothetical protein